MEGKPRPDPQTMFEEHYALVFFFANRWLPSFPQDMRDDVLNAGRLALWKACCTYNPSQGVRFATYAGTVIKNELNMMYRQYVRHARRTTSLEAPIAGIERRDDDTITLTYADVLGYDPQIDSDMAAKEIERLLSRFPMAAMYVHGTSQRAIGRIFGCSQSYASRKIQHQMNLLRDLLARKFGIVRTVRKGAKRRETIRRLPRVGVGAQ